MSERATSILMIVVGGLFALVGLALLALGRDVVLGWGLITFFGAVALIGTSTVLPGRGLGPLALPIAGVLMGVGCGILAYLLITDPDEFRTSRYPPEVLIPVTLVGAVFFGGGSIVVLILMLRNRRALEPDDEG